MTKRVFVVGVGMTKFEKPRPLVEYTDLGKEAIIAALNDSKLDYKEISAAICGYVLGDSTCGQAVCYEVGMTGIPIINVNNNCSTGATALFVAKQLVEGGIHDCCLALGFEKMFRGPLITKYNDRPTPMQRHADLFNEMFEIEPSPITAQFFGQAGLEHMRKYGSKPEHFAKIAKKNHAHSVNNPNSQLQQEHSLEEILDSETSVFHFLTKLQCCPTSSGAACAILCSEEFVKKHKLEHQAVEIVAMEMATDPPSTFEEKSAIKLVGYDMTKLAADKAYKNSNLKPEDIQVIELHDCYTVNELLTYSQIGLCEEGKEHEIVDRNDNTYGGKWVINPSGGLLSKGHPLGATGLAQCYELNMQLRGEAGKRQVENCKYGLQQNVGLGGASVVAIYKLGYPDKNQLKRLPSKL